MNLLFSSRFEKNLQSEERILNKIILRSENAEHLENMWHSSSTTLFSKTTMTMCVYTTVPMIKGDGSGVSD